MEDLLRAHCGPVALQPVPPGWGSQLLGTAPFYALIMVVPGTLQSHGGGLPGTEV